MYTLELIAFTLQSALDAQAAGAQRIELCDNPGEGGTTPSYGFIKAVREAVQIDVYPIIRPRGGDFLYSPAEWEMMKADIEICKQLGCNGVVIGMLQSDGSIDKAYCRQLVQLAYPMGVTFHRAFDRAANLQQALEDVIEIGCERILTSGGKPNAADALSTLASLVTQADERIIIMPGSGVRADNIESIARATGAKEFHSSARSFIPSAMQYQSLTMQEQLQQVALNLPEASKIAQILKTL